MFEQRIKSVLVILGCAAAVAVARVAQLQLIEGDEHRATLRKVFVTPVRHLNFVRGSITDRHGQVLVRDAPCWDICVHYGILSNEQPDRDAFLEAKDPYLTAQAEARVLEGGGTPNEENLLAARAEIFADVQEMKRRIHRLTGLSPERYAARAARIRARVEGVRRAVGKQSGRDLPVLEERTTHAVVRRLDDRAMIEAQSALGAYPWVKIRSSTKRTYGDTEAFAHLLGRMRRVYEEDLTPEKDPYIDDAYKKYRADDTLGSSGVEALFEPVLRGRRGWVRVGRDGEEVRVDPVRGRDAALTLDADLQRAIYAELGRAIDAINRRSPTANGTPLCPGGSAVVLYLPPPAPGGRPRREVLALVSYPSYDPANYDYGRLVRQTWRQPLLFRAARQSYAPGSIVKPMLLAGGLTDGTITTDWTTTCTGMYAGKRCWILSRGMARHREDPLDAELSLKHSCNTYYYKLGQKMGSRKIGEWVRMFGVGRRPGLGLRAEGEGGIRVENESPLNLAIGQGPIDLTPLQAANLVATIATGEYSTVSLALDDETNRPVWQLPVSDAHWRTVRNGMGRVVNEPNGTAKAARLDSLEFELHGKTGSAQFGGARRAVRWAFRCRFPDGREETYDETDRHTLETRLAEKFTASERPEIVDARATELRPAPGPEVPDSHAWFVAYLQRRNAPLERPRIALAVHLEFAGGGGKLAAPVGKAIAEIVLASPHAYVGRRTE